MAQMRKWDRISRALRRSHDQICDEATEILKNLPIRPVTLDALCQMTPARQTEAAKIIKGTCNYSTTFGSALLAATRRCDLLKPNEGKKIREFVDSDVARLEEEIRKLQVEITAADPSCGMEVLDFVIARAYIAMLIGNPKIERYLRTHHERVLDGFKSVVAMKSLAT